MGTIKVKDLTVEVTVPHAIQDSLFRDFCEKLASGVYQDSMRKFGVDISDLKLLQKFLYNVALNKHLRKVYNILYPEAVAQLLRELAYSAELYLGFSNRGNIPSVNFRILELGNSTFMKIINDYKLLDTIEDIAIEILESAENAPDPNKDYTKELFDEDY